MCQCERIVKISQYLGEIWTRVFCVGFLAGDELTAQFELPFNHWQERSYRVTSPYSVRTTAAATRREHRWRYNDTVIITGYIVKFHKYSLSILCYFVQHGDSS